MRVSANAGHEEELYIFFFHFIRIKIFTLCCSFILRFDLSYSKYSVYTNVLTAYLVSSCVVPVHFGDRHLWKETQSFGSRKNYLKSKEPGVNAAHEDVTHEGCSGYFA